MNRPEPTLLRAAAASRRRNQLGQSMGAKGQRTRERLLRATETLLNTTPLRELSVAQIVRVAGTSTATFYVYFNDVSEAVLALIGELTQSPPRLLALVGQAWEGESGFDRAHEFVASYVEQHQRHASAFRVRNLASEEGDQRFIELRINAVWPLLSAMAGRVRERQASGELPADLHPLSAAGALLAMIERITVVQLESANGVTRSRLLHVAAFFAVVLFGDGVWESRGVDRRPALALAKSPPLLQKVAASEPPGGAMTGQVNLDGQAIGAKGARTRQRLIDATSGLLRAESLMDLSVAKIAKVARTSTSTFYLYFQDVSEAVLAALGQVTFCTQDLLALWEGEWDEGAAEQTAHEFVVRYIERWQENRALFQARNLAADEGDERFLQVRRQSVRPLVELIARRIAECQAQGRLPLDLHPASGASALLAMIERLAVTPHLNPQAGTTIESVSRAAGYFLGILVGAVTAPHGQRQAS